jgi:GTPase SAR1 family protein
MTQATNLTIKCIVLGDKAVGKTSFITKYLFSYFSPKYSPTVHPKLYSYTIPYPSPSLKLEIYECVNIPDFNDFLAVILLYDPHRPESLEYVVNLYPQILKHAQAKFLVKLIAVKRGKPRLHLGEKAARNLQVKLEQTDLKERKQVSRIMQKCIKFARKDQRWENRKILFRLKQALIETSSIF